MNIPVSYIDQQGYEQNLNYNLSRAAFVKHMAIAGQGYAPKLQKLLRTFSMFFHYMYYIQNDSFNNNSFSEPPIHLSDPTEKGQFSNLAGRAIADFLSKRINQSIFTVNYEAAMKLKKIPLNVRRPDLLAFTKTSMFAIEAKGYSGGPGNMQAYKMQSQTGGIPVNFSVACISYNLYNNIQCNYHDPYYVDISYDNKLLKILTKRYYSGLSKYLNKEYFQYSTVRIQDEYFYEIELSYKPFEKLFRYEFPLMHFCCCKILDYYKPRILLPIHIEYYSEYGITNEIEPFIFEPIKYEEQDIYIDNDRVGIKIKS